MQYQLEECAFMRQTQKRGLEDKRAVILEGKNVNKRLLSVRYN